MKRHEPNLHVVTRKESMVAHEVVQAKIAWDARTTSVAHEMVEAKTACDAQTTSVTHEILHTKIACAAQATSGRFGNCYRIDNVRPHSLSN